MPVPVRRSASSLTSAERAAFVAAVLELKRRGDYDQLVKDWQSQGGDQVRKELEEALAAA